MITAMSQTWYQDGLQFECTRCGKCCSGFPGFVWVNQAELRAIAEFREEPIEEVTGLYTRFVNGKRTLRDNLKDDCVFFDPVAGCTIYLVRPRQCRTWPFWDSNIQSPEMWERTQQVCPGAGHGELIPVEEITKRVKVIKI